MAGKATPLPPASLTPRRRRSPNGSNASAQKACMGCVTAPQDLFHRTAKLRKPHATPLRSCADSATPGSRSQPKLASRQQLSAASSNGVDSISSAPWSRPNRSGAMSARTQANSSISTSRSSAALARWQASCPGAHREREDCLASWRHHAVGAQRGTADGEAKIPMIVMVSGSSITVERSPYIVRTSFTLGQLASAIAGWALKNVAKKIVTLVNDWAPGLEAEATFKSVAISDGAQILESVRVPLLNPDFSPYLQRVRDIAPDTFFAVVPNYQSVALVKQFIERGMDKSGIRFVTTGDLTPDNELPNMPEAMLGLLSLEENVQKHGPASRLSAPFAAVQ